MKQPMETCEVCGNTYDKTFQVTLGGATHIFDSFECAIHALAPACNHCGCRILGHGSENEQGVLFCSAYCARESGVAGIRDRAS
jgi:nitrite reductase/ring-hydroxylating ferredoxin subunit